MQATAVPEAAQENDTYDVYVHNAQPLAEGEEKHVISVFVADESGLINRVAGVFARRGGLACSSRRAPLSAHSDCARMPLVDRRSWSSCARSMGPASAGFT